MDSFQKGTQQVESSNGEKPKRNPMWKQEEVKTEYYQNFWVGVIFPMLIRELCFFLGMTIYAQLGNGGKCRSTLTFPQSRLRYMMISQGAILGCLKSYKTWFKPNFDALFCDQIPTKRRNLDIPSIPSSGDSKFF